MRLLTNDIAAMFVANGQGLIDVINPNQNADNACRRNTVISLL
jgi:hypothetical protein